MQTQLNQNTLKILKFEPNDIQMINIQNNKVYSYVEISPNIKMPNTRNPLIVKALSLPPGFVYERQMTNLDKILRSKCESDQKNYFEQEQLNNTFIELVKLAINKEQNFYGYFKPENILINQQGQIRLKDPKICNENQYTSDDIQTLGKILYQCCTLKKENQSNEIIKSNNKYRLISAMSHYSIQMIANVWIMIYQNKKLYNNINFGQINKNSSSCKEYQCLLQDIKNCKQKIFNPSPMLNQKSNPQDPNNTFYKRLQNNFENRTFPHTDKKIIIIPPLNLNIQKRNKIQPKKLQFSTKKNKQYKQHNENVNQENTTRIKNQFLRKFAGKQKNQRVNREKVVFGQKNQRSKPKNQQSQIVKILTPMKNRSRTFGKKTK